MRRPARAAGTVYVFAFDGFGFGVAEADLREIKMQFTPERGGDVVLALSGEGMITISWGPLDRAKRHWGDLARFARESQKGLERAIPARVREAREEATRFAGHEAVETHLRQRERAGWLAPVPRAAETVHFYCEPSARYFGLLALAPAASLEPCLRVWSALLERFRCHA